MVWVWPFGCAWQFIQNINLYPDEFVTLLAMDMVRQKGAPLLPSGLFYEHGLLYSYLAGAASFLGEPALMGRLTSLVLGLLIMGLTYWLGQRWFSAATGTLAAIGLTLAPAAIHWHSRVRMYALLQLLVLLTLIFMLEGLFKRNNRAAWLAVLTYVGALLTQFVSIVLLPALTVAEVIGLQRQPDRKGWYADRQIWFRGLAIGAVVLIAFLVKRAGQPKGIEPLQPANALMGLGQVLAIYTGFPFDLGSSWQALAPFFLQPPVLVFTIFAPLAVMAALWKKPRYEATAFLAVVLALSTLIVFLFAPADRRDEKYLFMLLPVLLILGGRGMMTVIYGLEALLQRWQGWPQVTRVFLTVFDRLILRPMRVLFGGWGVTTAMAASNLFLRQPQALYRLLAVIIISAGLGWIARSHINELLTDVGEDYTTTFRYVADNMQAGDAILTGTPAAAHHYLGRNDYYAVQAGGPYDYRILNRPDGPVERWLGSPWLQTPQELQTVFLERPVWLVLERWGLLIQYYSPFFMQNILAQTEFVREDNGIIALKSLPNPQPLLAEPAHPVDADLSGVTDDPGRLKLRGYTLEGNRLTLYWEAIVPLRFDYTVFVNVQNQAGETVTQVDHPPLGSVYPTTLWPAGQVIRETSLLDLPPGDYALRVGMYRLETGERLWVPGDETRQNMVYLGQFSVPRPAEESPAK